MNFTIECCDLCHKPIKSQKHGVTITCGHSVGGWGHRETPIEWSGEVCPQCYEEYTKITGAVSGWLKKREGVRAPTIIIEEHDVSIVPPRESSPQGRRTPLLR